MKRIRKYISIVLCSVAAISLIGCNMVEKTPEAIAKTVLAKVGDTEITRGDVDKSLSYMLKYYKSQYGDDFEENEDLVDTLKTQRGQALNSLIEQEVLMKSKKDLKVEYTDKEIEEEVEKQVTSCKEQNENDKKRYKEYLKNYGYNNEKEFKEALKKNIILEKFREKITEKAEVKDTEVEEYYNSNISNYKVGAGGNVSHLLFADKEKGEQQAKDAKKLTEEGKSLEEISKMDEYKDISKYEDLGFQPYENTSLVKEFVDGYKNLAEGTISEPVQTSFGWHLILINGITKEEKTQPFDEVKDTIKEQLLSTKQNDLYTKKVEKLKKKFKIKTYDDRY